MAFPIIPRRRSGTAGNPTTLNLGELAVNTLNGELYLGADAGVTLLNGPVAAGTTVTEHTGDGTTLAFTFSGYNGAADGGYIVSVGGIDQPPSKYSIANTAGGTITFVQAPVAGELISVRAIVAGEGGGGGGTDIGGRAWSAAETYTEGDLVATAQRETWICIQNANTNHDPTTSPLWWQPMPADAVSLQLVPVATTTPVTGQGLVYNGTAWAPGAPAANATQIQGRNVATTAPTAGQVLTWNASTSKWEPQGGGGSVTFNTTGTHLWSVPASVRYASVVATAGDGSDGTATAGANGNAGTRAYFDENGTPVAATQGANGSNGTASAGNAGKEVSIPALSFSLAGGTAGLAGLFGYGGGGGGGGGIYDATYGFIAGAAGANGSGPDAGLGGEAATANNSGNGGAAGGDGASPGSGTTAGTGEFAPAGNGGGGGSIGAYQGGGGGGGANRSGGGGGGAAYPDNTFLPDIGQPGTGGVADTSMCAGGAGGSFTGALNFAAYAGGNVAIVISEGAGNASITITW